MAVRKTDRRKFHEVMAMTQAAPMAGSPWAAGTGRSKRLEERVSGEMRYRPLGRTGEEVSLKSKTVTPVECLHYVMNLSTSTVITGIDSLEILKQDLDAVKTFRPLTNTQVADLLARTAEAASRGKFEGFKTTNGFDGTARNPSWLGEADKGPAGQ